MFGLKKREKETEEKVDLVLEQNQTTSQQSDGDNTQEISDFSVLSGAESCVNTACDVLVDDGVCLNPLTEKLIDDDAEKQENEENVNDSQSLIGQEQESAQDKTDGFSSLAKVLGKSESLLKTEFYAYQIKELMAKLGNVVCADDFDKNSQTLDKLVNYNVGAVVVTPAYYERCRAFENKVGKNKIKFSTMIDYPNGESSFKAQLFDVKQAVKFGLDEITITIPKPELISIIGNLKARVNKLARVARHGFGYAVVADQNHDKLVKTLKILDGVKAERIVLVVDNLDKENALKAIKAAVEIKGDKRLIVYTAMNSLEDVTAIIELNADGVYVKDVLSLAKQLCNKFDIKI